MEPISFPQSNHQLAAPRGMENCDPLKVWTNDQECISCWRMTWRERFSALVFGRVWLWVYFGRSQPPVALMARRDIFKLADDVQ